MSSILKVDTIQNTGGTTGLTIDSSGRVLHPVIPFGQASTGVSAVTGGNKLTLDSNIISGGGLTVDTTNERMIVPVAGLYRIGYSHLTDNLTTTVGVEMRKNGTRIDGSRTQVKGQTYVGLTVHMLASLAVNDYIEWWVDTGTVHNNSIYNNMYVYLIG
tara:strand:- start:214 stop:690 length:477 start_codon:yes stop_codon:yes gene_type:complete